MPRRLTLQELDAVGKKDPQRGLAIIAKRARRLEASEDPTKRFAGAVTQEAVDAARERARKTEPQS